MNLQLLWEWEFGQTTNKRNSLYGRLAIQLTSKKCVSAECYIPGVRVDRWGLGANDGVVGSAQPPRLSPRYVWPPALGSPGREVPGGGLAV